MRRKQWLRIAAVFAVLALIAAGCGDDDDGGTGGAAGGSGGDDAEPSGLLADDGPCDTSLDPYPVGITTVFESPVLSLVDQVTALEASVDAFNSRGGIGGHCMDLTTCDSGADPNKEVDCARQFVDDGVVATLNDTTSFNPQGVIDVLEPAGLPRIGISPAVEELSSPVTYAIGAGGTGTTFMMLPPLLRAGMKKIAVIHVDTPTIAALFSAMQPMLDASGAELVAKIPVPAGTTDFQQFILAAEDAGAEGVMLPLGENEAVQVLQAAQQLGSELTYSASLGTFGQADVQEFGDFADQLVLNAELPPVTGDQERWPILADVIADLSASGEPELQGDQIKSSPFRSWVAVYSLVKIIEDFGDPDDISREAITAAFDAATDVDHFNLIPPWTPSASVAGPGPFSRVSQPWYYEVTFDTDTGEFVVADDLMNVVLELGGQTDYEQPPASSSAGEPAAEEETTTTTTG
jgi:ABC-type branched-subunit amino acid transport system substrate-binding protein